MFLGGIDLPESAFEMPYLFEHESAVRQAPECFFVRLQRALEIAHDTITINTLREPRFAQLRLERDRAIRPFLHRCTGVRLWINAVEIELAARNGKPRPCQCELRIKPHRLGIKRSGLFGDIEGSSVVDCDRLQVGVICCRILGGSLGHRFLLGTREDRKSTRLNSSHRTTSYAVFCLKQ